MSQAPLENEIASTCELMANAMQTSFMEESKRLLSPLAIYSKGVSSQIRIAVKIDETLGDLGSLPSASLEDKLIYLLILKMLVKAEVAADKLGESINKLFAEMAKFLIEKNKAYGNSVAQPINVFAKELSSVQQINVRIDDKLSRIARGSEFPGDDTDIDLAGYLILKRVICGAR